MRNLILWIVFTGLPVFCGCSAGIDRYGYELENVVSANRSRECPISIKSNLAYEKSEIDFLGTIEAYDTSFSVDCDEAYVLTIFCGDACKLGADVVNIVEERYPDFWSSCYRAKAEFLRYKNRQSVNGLTSDPKYDPKLIILRSQETTRRNKMAIEAGVMGGILGGIMVAR